MGIVVKDQYGVVTVQDEETVNKPKEIRFITPDYKELFRIPDGEQVLLCYSDGKRVARACKYLDDYHLLIGRNAYHICEFAERMKANGTSVVPFPEKRMIWSNRNLEADKDWIAAYREYCKDYQIEFPKDRDSLESKVYDFMIMMNDHYLSDERDNLDIVVGDEIIVLADVGLWNGRRSGYKIIESGNLSDCLYANDGCEYNEWYVDREGEFCSTQTHHDGTHYLKFRKWKPEATWDDRAELLEEMYDGKATEEQINALTEKLGRDVGAVYGWEFPTEEKERVSVRDAR